VLLLRSLGGRRLDGLDDAERLEVLELMPDRVDLHVETAGQFTHEKIRLRVLEERPEKLGARL